MSRKKTPPYWQEGSHEFDVVLPADRTKSGREETVRVGFSWKVSATRPPTARERPGLAADAARHNLATLTSASANEDGFYAECVNWVDQANHALTRAIEAWCLSQLRDASLGYYSAYLQAFDEKAPDNLRETVSKARTMIYEYITRRIPVQEALVTLQTAVDILLAAAARPPRNRRRFPVHLRRRRSTWVPPKPRVRPGSHIDTGRYRPAEVLSMQPEPPHIMKLSYGDEIDEDFPPHITNWKSVRKRKRLPSLKDVFSPGDWIRHPRNGYGRILAVRNSTMRVDFCGRESEGTYVPDADLSGWEKIDEPAPEEFLPVCERFPPGTWVDYDPREDGVVLAVEGDILKVLFRYGSVTGLLAPRIGVDGPVRKMDIAALDLESSWGRRWSWWWLHEDIYGEPVCACCGYPNFGQDDDDVPLERKCLICGHLNFDTDLYDDDVPVGLRGDDCWQVRDAKDFPHIGEPGAGSAGSLANLRRSLVRLLDKQMTNPSRWDEKDEKAVEQIRQEILHRLA